MKKSQQIGLMVLVAGLSGWVAATAATDEPIAGKKGYEYWVGRGMGNQVAKEMENHFKQGFEVERLALADAPPGYVDGYVFVVMRKEK